MRYIAAILTFVVPVLAYGQPLTPDLGGRWTTNINLDYEIAQTGDRFTWGLVGQSPEGEGTITGVNVRVTWYATQASATGEVTIDSQGRAVAIHMSNGVIFSRPSTGTLQIIPGALPGATGSATGIITTDAVQIDGRWNTNIGLAYSILQSGSDFVWGVIGRAPEGDGQLDGLRVEVRMTVGGQPGSATGLVGLDAHGRAVEIRMSNGVIFSRTLPPLATILPGALAAAPPPSGEPEDGTRWTDVGAASNALRIDGRWNSNLDLAYEIVQVNDRFSWGVAERDPEGLGRIAGTAVHVTWQHGGSEQSATGTISLDAHGRAIRIEMSNGIVFSRQLGPMLEVAPIDPSAGPGTGTWGEPATPEVIPIGTP